MPSSSKRPVVFIGSSSEGLPIAQALQVNLDRNAEVILWSQGVFGLSQGTLESLVDTLANYDFAILVLTPDDLTSSREMLSPSPRDNVIFELGLFMGGLGRARTFIVYDRTADIKLPSDLAGVTAATFQPPTAGTLQSALGSCCTTIQGAIEAQGARPIETSEPQISSAVQFKVLAGLLDTNAQQFIILMHDYHANLLREGRYMIGVRYEYEMQNEGFGGAGSGYFDVNQFCNRLADADLLTVDLRNRIGLTERGHAFGEWLTASGYKASYFWCDYGNWGERPDRLKDTPHPSTSPRNLFELHQAQANRTSSDSNPGQGAPSATE